MAKGVTTCDWLKRAIREDEECVELTINETVYTFCPEGKQAMIDFLDGVEATAVVPPGVDVSRTLLPNDHKVPAAASPARVQQVLTESKVAEEGSLPVMSDAAKRREAQRKLDAVNERHEKQQRKATEGAGSQHHGNRR